jgi:psp operon transcriptional activator
MVNLSAIGQSQVFLELLEQVSDLAKINRPVLILGERGTGKELVAHRLHYLSPRWEEPLVSINCGAFQEELLSSELFGHEKGSFTGAHERKMGRIERAEGGSLFLDELANSNNRFQELMLRVLEQGEYERVGGNTTLSNDVRIIAATNIDAHDLYAEELIRRDLLDRLSFAVLEMPPLKKRKEDIPLLIDHFCSKFVEEMHWARKPEFTAAVVEEAMEYHWPGNIRQLKNTIERSLFYAKGEDVVKIDWSPFAHAELKKTSETIPDMEKQESLVFPLNLKKEQEEREIELMQLAFKQAHGNHKVASAHLCLSYHQWRAMLKKHGLQQNGALLQVSK